MARYLKHTACPKCGSSDANAQYSDGSSFCFSCRKSSSARVSPYVTEQIHQESTETSLPLDSNTNYSIGAVAWLAKANVSVAHALQMGLLYSKQRDQLIFPFYDAERNLLAYQARNLSPVNNNKRYYTKGDINEILPIYRNKDYQTKTLVVVEDCLSAIRVSLCKALQRDAMPCLGSDLSHTKIMRLRPFYSHLDVFLDPNMTHHAQRIAYRAQLVGFTTRVVFADKDPKEFSDAVLQELLE